MRAPRITKAPVVAVVETTVIKKWFSSSEDAVVTGTVESAGETMRHFQHTCIYV